MREIIVLSGYLFAVFIGSILVFWISSLIDFPEAKNSGIKHAGMIIGFLERFIVLTLVLLNHYPTIALIFTAKSIARFEELKNRNFSEYYLVGTFASVSLAIFCGEVMKLLLRRI